MIKIMACVVGAMNKPNVFRTEVGNCKNLDCQIESIEDA